MKKITIFLIILIAISCNDKKKNDESLNIASTEAKDVFLLDSLFIGEPMAGDTVFFNRTINPAAEEWVFDQFDSIINRHGSIFSRFKSNEIIKSIDVTDDLSLELKRKKYDKDENLKDIQIVLYTKFKGIIKDSIFFYKFQIDKAEGKYIDQRLETLSFIDQQLNLYNLETYSSLSEKGVGPDSWNKYSIMKDSGKIKLLSDINSLSKIKKEAKEIVAPAVTNQNSTSSSSVEDLVYDFENTTFHYDCSKSDRVAFSLNWGDFSCPSNEIRFKAELIKKDANNFELKYSEIKGYAIETSLDSENYSKDISIGTLKYSNNKIEFTWLGFYNSKTKKRDFTQNPFTGKVENSFIVLKKCK